MILRKTTYIALFSWFGGADSIIGQKACDIELGSKIWGFYPHDMANLLGKMITKPWLLVTCFSNNTN
jgi:hypothetical protein